MKILAVDTATEACSAALWVNGEILERYRLAPREHNKIILPMIEELLQEAGIRLGHLDGIALGRGPGSFTGVRIATGVVQGLALGTGVPIVPVSTLAALALDGLLDSAANGYTYAHAAIDARMGEVYWATYKRLTENEVELIGEETVIAPELTPELNVAKAIGIGSGWVTYASILQNRRHETKIEILGERFPRAGMIARLSVASFLNGNTCLPDEIEPVYLRNDVAKKPAKKPVN